jgi:hypothetical protein
MFFRSFSRREAASGSRVEEFRIRTALIREHRSCHNLDRGNPMWFRGRCLGRMIQEELPHS